MIPGVAVTCIAIALACRAPTVSLAELLRDALCTDQPCVDFDAFACFDAIIHDTPRRAKAHTI